MTDQPDTPTPNQPAPGPATAADRTISNTTSSRDERAEDAILRAWPGQLGERVLAAVRDRDAFGALAWHLDQARRDEADSVALLRAVDPDSLTWAITDADDPAAFLTSRVRDNAAAAWPGGGHQS